METKNSNKAVLIGVGLILLVGAITFARPLLRKDTPKSSSSVQNDEEEQFPLISTTDLIQKMNSDDEIIIIDTRPLEVFKQEHIFGSINADQDTVGYYIDSVDTDTPIIIVGSNPNDLGAKLMANLIKNRDFKNHFVLSGGMGAWTGAHNPTIRSGNPQSISDQVKIRTISPEELKRKIDSKESSFSIIDLRSSQLFSVEHLPGAINIPGSELEQKTKAIPIGKEIIYYAQSEIESFQLGVTLFDLGFTNSQALEGGISAWKSKGYPVEQ